MTPLQDYASRRVRWELRPLEMAAYVCAGGNNEKGIKPGLWKALKLCESVLILGGNFYTDCWGVDWYLGQQPVIRYPKELVRFPVLLVVAANCL